jgi:hypothetical protein
MDKQLHDATEAQVKLYLDEMLDASIKGDYKTVRKLAKKIHKLAVEMSPLVN